MANQPIADITGIPQSRRQPDDTIMLSCLPTLLTRKGNDVQGVQRACPRSLPQERNTPSESKISCCVATTVEDCAVRLARRQSICHILLGTSRKKGEKTWQV